MKKERKADISANREGYKLFREVEDKAIVSTKKSKEDNFISTKEYNDLSDDKKKDYERAYQGKDQITPKEYLELASKTKGEEANYTGRIDTKQKYQQDYRPVDFYQVFRGVMSSQGIETPQKKESFNQKDVDKGIKEYNEINDTNYTFDDIFEIKEKKVKGKKFFNEEKHNEYMKVRESEGDKTDYVLPTLVYSTGQPSNFPESEWEPIYKIREFKDDEEKEKFKKFILGLKEKANYNRMPSAIDITSPDRFGKVQYQGTGVVLGDTYETALHTYYNMQEGFSNAKVQVTITLKKVGEFTLPASIRKPNKEMTQALDKLSIGITKVEDALR